jgi:hypothetical protein
MLEPDEFDEATKLIMEAFDAKFIGYLDESKDSLP